MTAIDECATAYFQNGEPNEYVGKRVSVNVYFIKPVKETSHRTQSEKKWPQVTMVNLDPCMHVQMNHDIP